MTVADALTKQIGKYVLQLREHSSYELAKFEQAGFEGGVERGSASYVKTYSSARN